MRRSNWYHFLIGGALSLLLFFSLSHLVNPFIGKLLYSESRILYFIGVNLTFIVLTVSFFLVLHLYQGYTAKSLITDNKSISVIRAFKGFIFWLVILTIPLIISIFTDPETYIKQSTIREMMPFLILSLLLTPIQTSIEEVIFRSYLIKGLKTFIKNRVIIVALSSTFFALLHMWNPEVKEKLLLFFFIYFGMALLLSYLTVKYSGIEYSMGIHFANNFFAIVFLNYKDSPLPTAPLYFAEETSPELSFLTFIFSAIVVLILITVSERKNDKKYNI